MGVSASCLYTEALQGGRGVLPTANALVLSTGLPTPAEASRSIYKLTCPQTQHWDRVCLSPPLLPGGDLGHRSLTLQAHTQGRPPAWRAPVGDGSPARGRAAPGAQC